MPARPSNPSRPVFALLGGLALSVAAIALFLAAGEAAVRLSDPATSGRPFLFNLAMGYRTYNPAKSTTMQYSAVLGHEPRAGAVGTFLGREFSFSEHGLRNGGTDAAPIGEGAILAVGDSFTEGWKVEGHETWPANLERVLRRPVLNAGVRAYGIDQMVLRAESLAPRLEPRAILLAFIDDDISRSGLALRHGLHKPYFAAVGDGIELRNVPVPATFVSDPLDPLRRVLGYSYLLDFVMGRLDLRGLWTGDTAGTGFDAELVSCRLMTRFADLTQRLGVPGIVIALRDNLAALDARDVAKIRNRTSRVLGCAHHAGLITLDTYAAFDAMGSAGNLADLYDDAHFNARGNALVARMIASTLEELAY